MVKNAKKLNELVPSQDSRQRSSQSHLPLPKSSTTLDAHLQAHTHGRPGFDSTWSSEMSKQMIKAQFEGVKAFDGQKKEETITWLYNIQSLAQLTQVDPVKLAQSKSTGPLRDAISTSGHTYWKNLKRYVVENFTQYRTSFDAREALLKMTYKAGDSVTNHCLNYLRLLCAADERSPVDIHDRVLIDSFCTSLPQELCQKVGRSKSKTLFNAIAFARAYAQKYEEKDSLRQAARGGQLTSPAAAFKTVAEVAPTPPAPTPASSAPQNADDLTELEIYALQVMQCDNVNMTYDAYQKLQEQREGLAKAANRPLANNLCYKCGHPGHWARECQTQPKNYRPVQRKYEKLRRDGGAAAQLLGVQGSAQGGHKKNRFAQAHAAPKPAKNDDDVVKMLKKLSQQIKGLNLQNTAPAVQAVEERRKQVQDRIQEIEDPAVLESLVQALTGGVDVNQLEVDPDDTNSSFSGTDQE